MKWLKKLSLKRVHSTDVALWDVKVGPSAFGFSVWRNGTRLFLLFFSFNISITFGKTKVGASITSSR